MITSIIGPSGCGKSTLLRVFNRMNDTIENVRIQGQILIDGQPVYGDEVNLLNLRKKVGMVFQRPNPFPMSIFDNVSYGPRIHRLASSSGLRDIVERCLKSVELWDVLKGKLQHSALSLSGEQQQRLCIARLLAVEPEILLMDEPCSALDPIATAKIEELMFQLKERYTIVIVTHNMQQAARVSDETGFMLLGELVEFGKTDDIFTTPSDTRTNDYISGRFG
jgi:phosphate transport system ATP-binding protein